MALSATALISLAEAKTHLSIGDTSQDTLLEALIDGCSARILAYLQNHVVIQSRTERHYGGKQRIYLQRYPYVSGLSITDEALNTVPSTDFTILAEQGIVHHAGGCWPIAQDANGNVSRWIVVYAAGLAVNTAAVPADLKQACKAWVAILMARRDPSVTSKRVGDLAISYSDPGPDSDGVPPEICALLAPYVSRGV